MTHPIFLLLAFLVGVIGGAIYMTHHFEEVDNAAVTCQTNLEQTSMALVHANNGAALLTVGEVCVIDARSDLDETVFTGYLTSCRKSWDLRRSNLEQ